MDETHALLPVTTVAVIVLALINVVVDTPPLIWHIRNRNVAAAGLVYWILQANLMNFINAIIWPTDDIHSWFQGRILCDIETKLIPASYVGVVGSLVGIMRNLAGILNTEKTVIAPTRAQRQRQLVLDVFLSFGFPCIIMALHYVVQPFRFAIRTTMGCYPPYDLSWPSVVMVLMWPAILAAVVVYYCGMYGPSWIRDCH